MYKPLKLKNFEGDIILDINFSQQISPDEKYGDYTKIDQVKNKIDNVNQDDWTKIRKFSNIYEAPCYNTNKKVISRAYYKLWEILCDYKVGCNTDTLHLCEAPGGFIQAMLEYKKIQFQNIHTCHTISLNQGNICATNDIPRYHEVIIDNDKVNIMKHFNGDLYNSKTLIEIYRELKDKTIGFITADGGITDNGDYNNKEILHTRLILSQIFIACVLLEDFGDFVIKVFDIFTDITVEMIFLLNCLFDEIQITKPLTSRPTNSEKYIVCKGFIKSRMTNTLKNSIYRTLNNINLDNGYFISSLVYKNLIPNSFIEKIKQYNNEFINQQINFIEKNLKLLSSNNNVNIYELLNKKKIHGKNWMIKYHSHKI